MFRYLLVDHAVPAMCRIERNKLELVEVYPTIAEKLADLAARIAANDRGYRSYLHRCEPHR
jgi:hypothetical protein